VRLLALFAAALLGCCPSAPPEAPKPVNPVQWAVAHTEFLEEAGCTGVLVSPNRLVTAKHCLDDEAAAGDVFEDRVLSFIHPAEDFAVASTVIVGTGDFIPMRRAVLGEHVWVVGFPVQLDSGEQVLTVTDGIVAGPSKSDREFRITAPAYFGNSGGGVWGDDGALLGIAVSLMVARVPDYRWPVPYGAMTYVVPIQDIWSWL
jgi:S1-C subfamily serine protease